MTGKHLPDPVPPVQTAGDMGALQEEVDQLREAINSHRNIGMAIGLMSAKFACTSEQSWRLMLRISQHSNVKVRDAARVLVSTHDGSASAEDRRLLNTISAHLPPSGWP